MLPLPPAVFIRVGPEGGARATAGGGSREQECDQDISAIRYCHIMSQSKVLHRLTLLHFGPQHRHFAAAPS